MPGSGICGTGTAGGPAGIGGRSPGIGGPGGPAGWGAAGAGIRGAGKGNAGGGGGSAGGGIAGAGAAGARAGAVGSGAGAEGGGAGAAGATALAPICGRVSTCGRMAIASAMTRVRLPPTNNPNTLIATRNGRVARCSLGAAAEPVRGLLSKSLS